MLVVRPPNEDISDPALNHPTQINISILETFPSATRAAIITKGKERRKE